MAVRRPRGQAKIRPQVAFRIGQDQKALIERTAAYLGVSQAIAIDLLLENIPTTLSGVPQWAEEMAPDEDQLPLKTA